MEILMGSNLRMSKPLIEQYFCHYERLEEYKNGMWRRPKASERDEMTKRARSFMMNVGEFSGAMSDVCEEWPHSCKANFTDMSINPVAWLGQAAVCHVLRIPESCTRAAWCELPLGVQTRANACAKAHIEGWRKEYVGQGELFKQV